MKNSVLVQSCSLLYPTQCCSEILENYHLEAECLKAIVSKSLGYGIIAGSTIVKLPQVFKMVRAKSGAGITFAGVVMELLAVTFAASYALANNYPFSSWGESLFLMLETAAIAFLILFYELNVSAGIAFVVAYTSIVYALFCGLTPLNVLWSFQACNLPLVICGKLIQALKTFQAGHTGQLSGITLTLLSLGSFARIFTSIRETGDTLVVLIYVAATVVNFILFFQLIYYWNATNKFLEMEAKKKKR